MKEKPENFTEGIHNDDYENEYLQTRLNASDLVNITGREVESLNGKWNFGVDLYDTCRRSHWWKETRFNADGRELPLDYDWESWEYITVPSCWNLQKDELRYFEGCGVYTRTFRYFPRTTDEHLLLRFEGVAYRTTVFLNGKIIGTHDGASTPFNADITDIVKNDNRIIVSVDAARSPVRLPMENTDWFNYGGIYRDIYLVRLPPVYIKDWFVRLAPDGNFSTALVDVYIAGADKTPVNGKVRVEIPELGILHDISVGNGKGEAAIPVKPELWSPENPKLYDVVFTLNSDSHTDTARDRIGFRTIAVKGQEIYLNGSKIFLSGVCVHEDHFALGKTTNEDIIRAAIRDLKEMNGVYFRLAHYPHDSRFARIADEEGVLLWEEIPVYWAIAFDNPETYKDAENQLSELILRDRNRASVIIWSIGNENADTGQRLEFMSLLAKKAKELDNSRLVSAACLIKHEKLMIEDRLAEYLDVIGINEYYGWYDPDFEKLPRILTNSNPGKPVLVCEFGGDARLGQRGTADELWTEDKQKRVYEQQVETFKKCPYIAGTTPWILYDFRCPRRLNRYQEGFNRKGLIDADRKTRKPAFYVMREFYSWIKTHETKTTKLPVPTAKKLPSSWKGFNLLNMFSLGGKVTDLPFNENEFKMMSDWGFNFVRIPIDYRILIRDNDWNNMNESAVRRLDRAVEYGIKHDIHICLNLHRAPGYTVATPVETTNLWTQKEPQEAFVRMWGFFTGRYKDVPNEYLSFNFINEPAGIDEKPYAAVIKKAADAIRAIDPYRVLIADGLEYGRIPSDLIRELGIAQATRGYEPFQLTHYRANWVQGSDNFPLPAWPSGNREWLKNTIIKPWDDLIKSCCGVMVGEWGAHNRTPHDVVLRWMEDNLISFKEAGMGWALWNLTGSFGILNSGRDDVDYEDFNGYKLDRKMLNLLQKYLD